MQHVGFKPTTFVVVSRDFTTALRQPSTFDKVVNVIKKHTFVECHSVI